ncbi:hypothetical protein ACT1UF_02690 [Clostridium septicum]|uniref:hypothetical protein n=1 Tax=Clostridium septicum TaxID=1504 RepID=UPI00083235C0|nr:hypothetical protein [Clostridium septicum]WLF69924.1 hypothetical protein Q6375_02720 [Clostridium septicum]
MSTLAENHINQNKAWTFSSAGKELNFAGSYWLTVSVLGAKVSVAVGTVSAFVTGLVASAIAFSAGLASGSLITWLGTEERFY